MDSLITRFIDGHDSDRANQNIFRTFSSSVKGSQYLLTNLDRCVWLSEGFCPIGCKQVSRRQLQPQSRQVGCAETRKIYLLSFPVAGTIISHFQFLLQPVNHLEAGSLSWTTNTVPALHVWLWPDIRKGRLACTTSSLGYPVMGSTLGSLKHIHWESTNVVFGNSIFADKMTCS